MTPIAFILIFISVFLHAAWNFLSKKNNPSAAYYMIASATASLIWLGFFLCSPIRLADLPPRFWLMLAFSTAGEVMYSVGLAYGYRNGDISMVYPLGRALPVLLTAAVTSIFGLGKTPGMLPFAGMALIFTGCILMPLKHIDELHWRTYCTPVIFYVLLIAVGVTTYTIFDSEASRLLNQIPGSTRMMKALFYLFFVEAAMSVALGGVVLANRHERAEFKRLFLKTSGPLVTGLFSSSAYGLVLLAMNFVTNVSYIQAFRQMSLPLGVLAGVFILHERCSRTKLLGISLVVTGLVMVSF